MIRLFRPALGLALCLAWLSASTASAESALLLPPPEAFGVVSVETYDEEAAERVGPAFIDFEQVEDGRIRFTGSSGIEGAENTVIKALFRQDEQGRLTPLWQESRSRDAKGNPLGVMTINHEEGTGTCAPTGEEAKTVALPEDDRVANVILAHALIPLASEGEGEAPFQLLICQPSVRVVSLLAVVREPKGWEQGDLVEIEAGLDLGPVLNRLLSPWMPRVSIWFDGAEGESSWIGHRVPLFAKGPTVTVLRADIAPKLSPELLSP